MEDTLASRDLPVLETVVDFLDHGNFRVEVRDIAAATGLTPAYVDRALTALEGEFIVEYHQSMTGGDPNTWYVTKVTSDARRAVGQWPTAENLLARLADAFGEAAKDEPDPKRRGKLREVAGFLTGAGRDVATEVMAKVILRQSGMVRQQ